MGINIGDVEATLRLRDESVAVLQANMQVLQQYAGQTDAVSAKLDAMSAGMSEAGRAASASGQMITGMGESGRAALEALNPHVSALREYLNELKPSTEGAHGAFTDLKGTLSEMWENPLQAVGELGKALGTDLMAGLGSAALGIGAVAAAAAVGVTVMFELAEKAAAAGAQIYDLSLKTGMSTEAVSTLKGAVEIAGGSIDTVTNAIFMLQKRMGEDSPKFEEGLQRIGLHLEDIRSLTPDQMFMRISDALRDMSDPVERNAAGTELFGRQFRELVPTIMKDLPGMVDEFRDLGVAWSEEDAKGADEFEVASRKLHTQLGLITTLIGKELIPVFSEAMQFADWSVGWVLRWVNDNNSMEGWRQLRAVINTLNGDIGKLPAVTGSAADGVKALFEGTRSLRDATVEYDAANANLSAQLDDIRSNRVLPLTAEQKAMVLTLKDAKADTGDLARVIANDYNVSLTTAKKAIDDYAESHKKAEAAAKAHRTEVEHYLDASRALTTADLGYNQVVKDLGTVTVDLIRYDLEHKGTIEQITAAYGVQKEQVAVVKQELKDEAAVAKQAAEDHKKLLAELKTIEDGKNAESLRAIEAVGRAQQAASEKQFTDTSKMLTDLGKLNDDYNTELMRGAGTTADAQIAQVKKWADDEKLKYKDAEEFVRTEYYDKIDQLAQLKMQHVYEAHDQTFKDIRQLLSDLDGGPGGWTDTFSKTLVSTHSFTDAALSVWKQLQKDLENVAADMLDTMIKAFLQPFLDQLKGYVSQGASALGQLVAGVAGGGGSGYGAQQGGGWQGAAIGAGSQMAGGYLRGNGIGTGAGSDGYGVYAPGYGPPGSGYGTGAMEAAPRGGMGGMGAGIGMGALAGIQAAEGGGSVGHQLGSVGMSAGIGVGAGLAAGAATGVASGIGAGAGMAAVAGSTIAIGAATMGIGAAVIGAYMLYQHLKGISDEEKAARKAYEDWQSAADTTFTKIATDQEKTEAGGDKLKEAQVLARDAYVALGIDGSLAIKNIGIALDGTHVSADEVKKATDNMTQAIQLYEQELPIATQGQAAVAAQLSTMKSLSPEVQAALQKVYDSKNIEDYATNVTDLNELLKTQKSHVSNVDATLQKYGISWTELGTEAKEAKLSELAQGLTTDFATLRDVGIDVNAQMRGMGPKVMDFIETAQKAGVEVPSAMQTVIQTAIDAGEVYDENKQKVTDITQLHLKFGDTAKDSLQQVSDAITRLADVLTQGLGGAFVTATQQANAGLGTVVARTNEAAATTHQRTTEMEEDWRSVYDAVNAAANGESPTGVKNYIDVVAAAGKVTQEHAESMKLSWQGVYNTVNTASAGVDSWTLAMQNAKQIMATTGWEKGEASKLAAAPAAAAAAAAVASTGGRFVGGVMAWSNADVLYAAQHQSAPQTGLAEWSAAVAEAKRRGLAMAAGGVGHVDAPAVFFSGGNEDFAFSGEGKGFSRGGGAARDDMAAVLLELRGLPGAIRLAVRDGIQRTVVPRR